MQKDPLKLVSTRIFTAQIMCFSSKSVGRPPATGMGARNRQPVIRTQQPVNCERSTLWLCQNSYWKWPFIVDFPIKNGDFP